MKTIIAVAGLPGSGKTTRKNSDPILKGLPFIDVADVYAELPGISSQDAFGELLRQVSETLETSDAVVIEASLAHGHWQRSLLEGFCQVKKIKLEYIELVVDPKVCLERVMRQYDEVYLKAESDDERLRLNNYFGGRVRILNYVMGC
jgi:predicted kinase